MERGKICRYFQNGKCKKDDCPFVHKKQFRPACKFWKAGHCKFGEQCQFYHQIKKDREEEKKKRQREPAQQIKPKYQIKAQIKPQTDADQQKKEAINRLLGLQQPKQQRQNKQSKPTNINFNKKIIINFSDLSKTLEGKQNIAKIDLNVFKQKPFLQYLKTLTTDLDKQKAQVIRRFQYSFHPQTEDSSEYRIKLCPLAPNRQMKLNFPIQQKCLQLQILHSDKIKSIEILNESIPQHFKQALNIKIKCQLQTKNIYQTLKYIENSFERICEQVDFLLENRQAPKTYAEEQKMQVVENSKEKEKKERGSEDEEEDNENNVKKQRQIKPQIELSTVITVQKIDLNCEILIVEDILLHLVCDCSNQITYVLRAKGRRGRTIKAKIRCPKCREVTTIYMTRLMIGKSGEDVVLGRAGVIGGKIDDIGGVSWKIICQCQNFIFTEQLTLSGVRRQVNCFTCFKQYSIQYYGIYKFNPFLGQVANKPAYKFEKGNQSIAFKLDTQLPNKGSCKHSKFSHRFFRYPCCGRAFACQKCHDEKTDSHKVIERAEIIICGFCSCEQPITNVCKRCKRELVKGSDKAGHWEGGAGCRDKALLSRNDAKKYTGINKTIPNKK